VQHPIESAAGDPERFDPRAYRPLTVEREIVGDVEVAGRRRILAGAGDRERHVAAENGFDDDRVGARERVRFLDGGAHGAGVRCRRARAVTGRDVDLVRHVVDREGGGVDPTRERDESGDEDDRSETASHMHLPLLKRGQRTLSNVHKVFPDRGSRQWDFS